MLHLLFENILLTQIHITKMYVFEHKIIYVNFVLKIKQSE